MIKSILGLITALAICITIFVLVSMLNFGLHFGILKQEKEIQDIERVCSTNDNKYFHFIEINGTHNLVAGMDWRAVTLRQAP